jgi:hypothetical protein
MGGGPRPGRTVRRGPAAVRTGGHRGTGAHRRGEKWRAEHGSPVSGLTEAWVAVWWPGNGDEAVAEEKLGDGSAQASGEGEKRGMGVVRGGEGLLLF